MAETQSHLDNPHVHHEESDVNIAAIFRFVAVLGTVLIIVGGAMWLLFRYFDRRETSPVRIYPMAVGRETALPPEPRLQERPREELRDLRAREDAMLTSYGWVDREAGRLRIPIDRAMQLTLQRGLPARSDASPSGPGAPGAVGETGGAREGDPAATAGRDGSPAPEAAEEKRR
jgi:hypothetical protein